VDTELLVESQLDGQRLVDQLVRDGFPVEAAFWVKNSSEGLWHLYVASPAVDPERIGQAYGVVNVSLSKLTSPWVSLTDVKLIRPDNPIARDVLDILRRSPGPLPTRTRRPRLGAMEIEEAYIYPLPGGPMTRDEVLKVVAGLISRSGQVPPATMTLRNGTTVRGVPVRVEDDRSGKVRITVQDFQAPGAQAVDVDADEVIAIR
jgi:hypothetical protein